MRELAADMTLDTKQAGSRLYVVIPGLLGSILVKDGEEIWGTSPGSMFKNLFSFVHYTKQLQIPPDFGVEEAHNGISASKILPSSYILPAFWKVDGYGDLIAMLTDRLGLIPVTSDSPGNLIQFPYDWRLPIQTSARKLAKVVWPALERFRRESGDNAAKLVFVCHSMGGLVARYFLEVLGGHEATDALVAIGTPFQGSINAIDALANEPFSSLGRLGSAISEMLRTFPSIYQLLPTYSCVQNNDNSVRPLRRDTAPGIETRQLRFSHEFHEEIEGARSSKPGYRCFVIKGIDQPTYQSVSLEGGKLIPSRLYRGEDLSGDGTVPRPSAHPREWQDDASATFISSKHAILQSTQSTHTQLLGLLTGRQRQFMGSQSRIGIDTPEIVSAGSALNIAANLYGRNLFSPLYASCASEDRSWNSGPKLMKTAGDGTYTAMFEDVPKGVLEVRVSESFSCNKTNSLSDWTLAWDSRDDLI